MMIKFYDQTAQFKILKDMKIVYESKIYSNEACNLDEMEADSVEYSARFSNEYFCIQIRNDSCADLKTAEWIYKQKKKDNSQKMTDKMCDYEFKANCEVFSC